jgi:cation transport ATPase
VLTKNAEALERHERMDALVVDKTGTLTEGKAWVTAVVPATGIDEAGLLRLAASVERTSEHLLPAAIVAAAAGARRARRLRYRQAGAPQPSSAENWANTSAPVIVFVSLAKV